MLRPSCCCGCVALCLLCLSVYRGIFCVFLHLPLFSVFFFSVSLYSYAFLSVADSLSFSLFSLFVSFSPLSLSLFVCLSSCLCVGLFLPLPLSMLLVSSSCCIIHAPEIEVPDVTSPAPSACCTVPHPGDNVSHPPMGRLGRSRFSPRGGEHTHSKNMVAFWGDLVETFPYIKSASLEFLPLSPFCR